MKKSIFILTLVLLASQLQAQDFVDIIRASANNTNMGNVDEDDDYVTNINNQKLEFYYPKRANDKLVILSGFTLENTTITLFEGDNRRNLLMARLNLGIKHQHSEKLAGTYLVLPKIASDFKSIGAQDFQLGGLALMEYLIAPTWKVKLGLYVSSENHGSTITPLIGLWHRSKNEKFYIDAVLPIRMDINYTLVKTLSIGADVLTSVKAYNLFVNDSDFYVQEESIRLAAYLSYGFLDNALLFRVRAGLDLTDYSLYNVGDKIGGQLLTTPLSGDNRNRLNPEFASAFYFGGDLIYRFDLRKEKK